MQNTLAISELFSTIQAEGVSTGVPAFFVRLQGCDLHCSFCDTPYTWKPGLIDKAHFLTAKDILERIRNSGNKTVVITGGEPLLQQKRPAFLELLSGLDDFDIRSEIETAGHIPPTSELCDKVTQWNISPKLSYTGNDPIDYKLTLPHFHPKKSGLNSWLKFVVGVDSIQQEIDLVSKLVDLLQWPRDRVLLMPEGVTAEAIQNKSPQIVELCKSNGFRFSTRLHVLLWGAKRGV